MSKPNTKPPGGTRDFLALTTLQRRHVIGVIEEVYESYGFEPLETPTFERLGTLLDKYGDEGDQLIFRIAKRGEKLAKELQGDPTEGSIADFGLKYDLTVPLARVYAEYRDELPRVYKRYQIQPVYRADRPAGGRYREFFQCDVDVVGSRSNLVEAELLDAAAEVFDKLGFSGPGDYTIRLNHRAALRGLIESAAIPGELEDTTLVAIDKLDKIGLEGVREELVARGIAEDATGLLLAMLADAPATPAETLKWAGDLVVDIPRAVAAVGDLEEIVELTARGPAGPRLRIDPFLARGLSYYTGPIFEIELAGVSGSAAAGGRYDDLIGMFLGQEVPASGISLGLERILLVMAERGLFPSDLGGEPQVLVALRQGEPVDDALDLARELRAAGLRVDVYPEPDNYGRQFKYGEQRRIPYVALLSAREVEAGVVRIKDLATGDQQDVARGDAAGWLSSALD